MKIKSLLFTVLFAAATSIAFSQEGLVFKYSFEGNVNDGSANGHNATAYQNGISDPAVEGFIDLTEITPTYVEGKVGQCMAFREAWIQTPANVFDPSTGDFTFAAWVYQETISDNGNATVIAQELGTGETGRRNWLYTFKNNDHAGKWTSYLAGGTKRIEQAITLNTWTHITMKYEAGVLSFYVDGVKNETTFEFSAEQCDGSFNIGRSQWALANKDKNSFNGLLDEVQLYSRALTDTEISSLANPGTTTTASATVAGGGDFISGDTKSFTVTVTDGEAPYVVSYSDGTNDLTANSDDATISIDVTPAGPSTTYTVTGVTANGVEVAIDGSAEVVFTETVVPTATVSGSGTYIAGENDTIFVEVTDGTAPYVVSYNDGTNDLTHNSDDASIEIIVTPTGDMTYTVTGITANGVDVTINGSAEVVLTEDNTTSFVDLDSEGLYVYPNPVNTEVYFSKNVKSVGIYNISGQLVRSKYGNLSSIHVGALEKGIYLLKLESEKGIVVRKILKQ